MTNLMMDFVSAMGHPEDWRNVWSRRCLCGRRGQHQMWAAQFIQYEAPSNARLNSGGAGTMDMRFLLRWVQKSQSPERLVWAIDGDGASK